MNCLTSAALAVSVGEQTGRGRLNEEAPETGGSGLLRFRRRGNHDGGGNYPIDKQFTKISSRFNLSTPRSLGELGGAQPDAALDQQRSKWEKLFGKAGRRTRHRCSGTINGTEPDHQLVLPREVPKN